MIDSVGKFCMEFRKYVLRMTLKEICGDIPVSSLSSFEHGKANNINYLFVYFNACKTYEMKEEFIKGVFGIGSKGGI